jgi:Ca-activated chloride channel family protein
LAQAGELLGEETRTADTWATTTLYLLALALLLALPGSARPRQSSTPGFLPLDPYKISVRVSSVVLHATVRNHSGASVSGLDKNDFHIYEDGVPQPIEYFSHDDIPVTVGLVLDNSGSMQPNREQVIAASMAFARSSNLQDQMFIVNFNEHVSLGLPGGTPFTDQSEQLQVALGRFRADGETALYDAVALALGHLKLGNRDKKVLIVVSDGGDNASKHTLEQILTLAAQSDAIIYSVDIHVEADLDRNPKALRRLAAATGGEDFVVESLPEVVPICERIAHDIREQYTLAYSPTNRREDGLYRVILVKAKAHRHGNLSVVTRAGYYSPLQPQPLAPVAGAPGKLP